METIYLLPGVGGSSLGWNAGLGITPTVWGQSVQDQAVLTVALNLISHLQLNPDGSSKYDIFVRPAVFSTYYNAIIKALSADFKVVWTPYDWRLRPSVAQAALTLPEPGWLLCHSMGGLIAANLYARLLSTGDEGLIKGIICCGTPWRLNVAESAVKACFGVGELFYILGALAVGGHLLTALRRLLLLKKSTAPIQELLATFLTLDSLSTLLPNVPFQARDLQRYRFSEGFEYMTQDWLNRGMQEKALCLNRGQLLPPGFVCDIISTNIATPVAAGAPDSLAGDGVVLNNARLVNYPVFELWSIEHVEMLNSPQTAEIVTLLVSQNFPTAEMLDLSPLQSHGVAWRPGEYGPSKQATRASQGFPVLGRGAVDP